MCDYSARPNIRYTSGYQEHPRVRQARGHPKPPLVLYGYPPFFARQGEPRARSTSGIHPRPYSDYGKYPKVPLHGNGYPRMPIVAKEYQRLPQTYYAQPRVPFEQPARQRFPSDHYGRAYKTKVYYSRQLNSTAHISQFPEDHEEKLHTAVPFPNQVPAKLKVSAEYAQYYRKKIGKEDVLNSENAKPDGTGNTKKYGGSLEGSDGKCDVEQSEDGKVIIQNRIGSSAEETCESITKFLRELLLGKEQTGNEEALVVGDRRKDNVSADTDVENGNDLKEKSIDVYNTAETDGSDAKVNVSIADDNKVSAGNDKSLENRENIEPEGPQRDSDTYDFQKVPRIIITIPEEDVCEAISGHLHELLRGDKKSQCITKVTMCKFGDKLFVRLLKDQANPFLKAQHGKADDDEAINDSRGNTEHHGRLVTDAFKVDAELKYAFTNNLWDRIAYAMTEVDRAERQLKRDDTDCNPDENQADQGADYQIYNETNANIAKDSKENVLASPESKYDPCLAPERGQSSSFISSVDNEENYFISCFRFH